MNSAILTEGELEARTLSVVSVLLRRKPFTSSSTERESIFVRDKSSDLRQVLTFRAAAKVTHARLSTPFHDRFNVSSTVFTYIHRQTTPI